MNRISPVNVKNILEAMKLSLHKFFTDDSALLGRSSAVGDQRRSWPSLKLKFS